MNKLTMCCAVIAATLMLGRADELFSNVCARVDSLFQGNGLSETNRAFVSVRSGGFDHEMTASEFRPLCTLVSNNCADIASSWDCYRTNEVVRFSVLSAVGFSGEVAYTNFLARLLVNFESGCTSEWKSIEFMASPYGTPMDGYLARKISSAGCSNLVSRIRSIASIMADTETALWCDEVMSGAAKQELEDLDAIELQ